MAKLKTSKKRVLKIWHIFRFAERFEMPEDFKGLRQSPLKFTKDFVGGGSDDESISFVLQMQSVDGMDDHLMLKGAFGELKRIAANRSRCYRGYLLDEKLGPASERRISQWLRIDLPATRKVLKALASAGLIEKVDVPKFDTSVNDGPQTPPPPKSPKKKPKKKEKKPTAEKTTAKKTAKKKPKTKKKKRSRASLGQPGAAESPFKKTEVEGKVNLTESGSEKNKENKTHQSALPPDGPTTGSKEPDGPKASQQDAQYQAPCLTYHATHSDSPSPTTEGKHASTGNAVTQHNQADGPMCPTESDTSQDQQHGIATPSGTLTESDAGAGSSAALSDRIADVPPRSASPGCRGPAKSGEFPHQRRSTDPVDQLAKIYNHDCKQFAVEIYEAIRCSYPVGSRQCNQELGCFATAWETALSKGLPPSVMQGLWDKSVKEAEKLNRKRGRIRFSKSAEAVWMHTFNKRLAARVAEANQKSKTIAM